MKVNGSIQIENSLKKGINRDSPVELPKIYVQVRFELIWEIK